MDEATLQVGAAGLTLDGGGTVSMGPDFNAITGSTTGIQILTNVDNTISGSGYIGRAVIGGQTHDLEIVNQASGVIDGFGGGSLLVLSSNEVIINNGLIEATGSRGFVSIAGSLSGHGTIFAGAGANVQFTDPVSVVDGQTLSTAASGTIAFGGSVTTHGEVANAGEIFLIGPGHLIFDQDATLSGGGVIRMGGGGPGFPTLSGTAASVVLTDVDNIISRFGQLGNGELTLVNEAGGVIDATHKRLTIDTGANIVTNAGLIEATGKRGMTIASAIANSGTLAATGGGALTVNGAVTGAGVATVNGGTLDFTASFTEDVAFSGTTGVLALAQSRGYGGSISGFSKTGATSLDLGDIGFVGSTEATFSGTATGGVLTVTDGTRTAHIHLIGDYTASTFTASSDGRGGTVVVDSSGAHAASAHRFIAAVAGVGGSAGEAIHAGAALAGHAPTLARPHAMIA